MRCLIGETVPLWISFQGTQTFRVINGLLIVKHSLFAVVCWAWPLSLRVTYHIKVSLSLGFGELTAIVTLLEPNFFHARVVARTWTFTRQVRCHWLLDISNASLCSIEVWSIFLFHPRRIFHPILSLGHTVTGWPWWISFTLFKDAALCLIFWDCQSWNCPFVSPGQVFFSNSVWAVIEWVELHLREFVWSWARTN